MATANFVLAAWFLPSRIYRLVFSCNLNWEFSAAMFLLEGIHKLKVTPSLAFGDLICLTFGKQAVWNALVTFLTSDHCFCKQSHDALLANIEKSVRLFGSIDGLLLTVGVTLFQVQVRGLSIQIPDFRHLINSLFSLSTTFFYFKLAPEHPLSLVYFAFG